MSTSQEGYTTIQISKKDAETLKKIKEESYSEEYNKKLSMAAIVGKLIEYYQKKTAISEIHKIYDGEPQDNDYDNSEQYEYGCPDHSDDCESCPKYDFCGQTS